MQQYIQHLVSRSITLQRNEFLKVQGTIDTNIYFIENGSLRIFICNNGEEQIMRFAYKGNIIAVLDAYIKEKPSDFIIQAIKKTIVHVITKADLQAFLALQNNTNLWTSILEDLILQQLEREIDLLTISPKERYERVLKRSPQLFQEIPNRYIANYLRMTPETLSRLKKS